jgi:hypothetical protein
VESDWVVELERAAASGREEGLAVAESDSGSLLEQRPADPE